MADRTRERRNVFLCYASADRDRVRILYRRLCSLGVHVWFDVESLLPGQEWKVEIAHAIADCDFFVACLSRSATDNRGYFHKEVKLALDVLDTLPERNAFLIPVRLEECRVPTRLSHRQWVDLFGPNGNGIDRIAATILNSTSGDTPSNAMGDPPPLATKPGALSNFSTAPDLTYLNAATENAAVDEIIASLEVELNCSAHRNVRLRLAADEIEPLAQQDVHLDVHAVYTFPTALVALQVRFIQRGHRSGSGADVTVSLIRLRKLRDAGFSRDVHLVAAIVGAPGDFDPDWTRNHVSPFPGLPSYHVRYYQMTGTPDRDK